VRESVARHANIVWRFAGEGPLKDAVVDAARAGRKFEYRGQLSQREVIEAYREADVFRLPSFAVHGWEELFGIALIEALGAMCRRDRCGLRTAVAAS
jgi:glycosyltransferase involved in cell wall biosynthesis